MVTVRMLSFAGARESEAKWAPAGRLSQRKTQTIRAD
jgi:hypothetical protein